MCLYQCVRVCTGVAAFYRLGSLPDCTNVLMGCLWHLRLHAPKCKHTEPSDFNTLHPFGTPSFTPVFSTLQVYVFIPIFCSFFFNIKIFLKEHQTYILLLLSCHLFFREKRKEGEREGEKRSCVRDTIASRTPPPGSLARNPGVCPEWESNATLRFTGQHSVH